MKNRYTKPELAITVFENTDNTNVTTLSSVGYTQGTHSAQMSKIGFSDIKGSTGSINS